MRGYIGKGRKPREAARLAIETLDECVRAVEAAKRRAGRVTLDERHSWPSVLNEVTGLARPNEAEARLRRCLEERGNLERFDEIRRAALERGLSNAELGGLHTEYRVWDENARYLEAQRKGHKAQQSPTEGLVEEKDHPGEKDLLT